MRMYHITLSPSHSQGMLEVWLLSSLIVVNVWTSSEVKHFSLCQGLPGGTTVHSESTGCTDRLCLITESSAGKVCRYCVCTQVYRKYIGNRG